MPTIDSLAVRLEADVQVFQQQLDRARAELSKFATNAESTANATAKIGKGSTAAVPGLRSLNGAFVTLTRQITGVPPVVGQFTNVLGTLAIGVGPMALALAGVTALAAAFVLVTREAREAKKAAEEAGKAVTNAWLARQTQGDVDLIQQQGAIGAQLDTQARKVQRAVAARENKEYLAKLNADLLDLQTQYEQATALLTERRTERQKEAADRAAREQKRASDEIRKALKEQEEAAEAAARAMGRLNDFYRANRQFIIRMPVTGDPTTSPGGVTRFGGAGDRVLVGQNLPRQITPVPEPSGVPNFIGNLMGQFDPKLIASGLATGFISNMVNLAIPKLAELGKSILGLGSAADRMAVALRKLGESWEAELRILRGGESGAVAQLVQDAQRRINEAFEIILQGVSGRDRAAIGIPRLDASVDTMAEFEAEMARIREQWIAAGLSMDDFNVMLEIARENFDRLNDSLRDAARNIPQGYKIALAQFNATTPTAAAPRTLRVIIQAEPRGIFRAVEQEAVIVRRTGGQLAWEIA